ncbi:SpoIIAA-like [Pelagirhabdus alkalitolerans]|uniref:SpoIIAA-like n=1 Tax=Pelagirhabdus alkalitolerans TaxID=1612202 RepID=A0A1G6ILU5_9BACI|nr:STAS/SEC14 domain-containing protein [Pelagirhabdus alkalitolerans]SDC07457.1 SpoIIAA-like [Pelagirhabdus alkalitolerans]
MLKKLNSSEANILEYEVTDGMSKAENDMLLRDLTQTMDKFGKVKLLVKLNDISVTEMEGFKERYIFAKEHLDKISKYAIVTDMKVAEAIQKVIDPITEMELKTFPPERENEARQWLR